LALNNIIVTNLAALSGSETSVPTLTPIYEIQGSDRSSPFVEQTVIIEGIVTGDFQTGDADETRNLAGFYVQDPLGDGDATTSDGIFVSEAAFDVDVKITDKVRITGVVTEFFGETQLRLNSVEVLGSGSITPTVVTLPTVEVIANTNGRLIADLEAFEGMLVTFPQTLSVTELFNLDRFGELLVSVGGVQEQFTNFNLPDAEGNQAHLRSNASRRIMVDDGLTIQNPDPIIYPFPAITTDNPLRLGDTVTNLRGNVRFSRGSGGSGDEIYRIMPRETPTFAQGEERPETPECSELLHDSR
jgi:predicted extracellular nuclease